MAETRTPTRFREALSTGCQRPSPSTKDHHAPARPGEQRARASMFLGPFLVAPCRQCRPRRISTLLPIPAGVSQLPRATHTTPAAGLTDLR